MKNHRDRAPRKHRNVAGSEKKGLIIVFTGDGKGKTTAAFGTALRAVGHGKKTAIVQFLKGKWKTGEVEAVKQFSDRIAIVSVGKGFTWETKNFKQDVRLARQAWEKCREFLFDDVHEVVILDEIHCVLDYGFLETAEVVSALQKKSPLKHVILTGRNAPPELMEMADLVTEMKSLKHPYQHGVPAQPGIEY